MSLLDTIEPALEIDPRSPVPPVGVTNLEKFLGARIPVIVFQKVAVSVLLGARAPATKFNATRPFTRVERVLNCCTKVVGCESPER